MRIVLDGELNTLRVGLTEQLGREHEGEVDARRDSGARDAIPVANHAFGHGRCSEERQEIERHPVGSRAITSQQTGGAEEQGAAADGRDVASARALHAQEFQERFVAEQRVHSPFRRARK